ncbi:hypothetical protein LTR17_012074 [Elasticomyces elasticus]|nr:hypothetical protein LTR17_012074 [Elasticomyces elasticus]
MATKRRSTRQAITRRTKRSPYVDPDTSEDELAYDLETESQTGDTYAPEEVPIAEPSRKRQKTAPRTRHQTRSKSISKPAATRKAGAKRRPNNLHTPPSPKTFKGPSDNKVPDWTSLPIDILKDIFIYASSPIHEQTRTAAANIDWLVKTARTCRAFAVPALEAFYIRPSLLTSQAPHRLLALLLQVKDEEGKRFMGYGVKVKGLEIDVRRLAYSAHNMGLFDICRLVEVCPQLQEVEILHPVDEPPFRTGKIQNWHYPTNLFTTMEEHGTRLRTFRWSRGMIPQTNPETYTLMAATHTSKPFEYLTKLTVCGFDFDPTPTADSAEVQTATAVATAPSLATSIALLPRLKDLTLISCEAVVDTFFSHLPHNLERLELTNCLELTSSMLETYLASGGGSQLRELVLNHNPSLSLSFLVKLRDLCPRLEVLRVDLRYYSERVNSNDAEPLYDVLLGEGEVPSWPATLRELEMVHLQRWQAEAAQNLFRSLVNAAPDLPDLRRLVLHTHISIPWRQRVEVRDQWIDRLQRVYARRSVAPSAYMGSLRQFREFKKAQEEGWDVKATTGRAKLHDLDDEDGDGEFTLGRRISHVAISPKARGKDIVVYDESSPEKRAVVAPEPSIRRSRRVAEASYSPPAVVDGSEDDELDEEVEEEDGEGLFVQGLCNVVDIRIDNQRPRENQFTEGDFLDSEVSGDEDWREGGSENGEEGYAW